MLLRDNPRSFLTGDRAFLPVQPIDETRDQFVGEVLFQQDHEGFIGIPHGGLPMGLCLDAWRRLGDPIYPVHVRYKFGGSGISIGESAVFSVQRGEGDAGPGVTASLTKNGDRTPYLKAEIAPTLPAAGAPDPGPQPSQEMRPLPYYRNCFVCGHHRPVVGLQRRFQYHEDHGSGTVTASWGGASEDRERAECFLIEAEELHPAVIVSIFDENTAWGGFMTVGTAGLSVRLDMTLLRPVSAREPLLFVGRPAGIRGNPKSPRFFLAEGEVLSMKDPGRPEPVAVGRGEWVVLSMYTEQIKQNLLPDDDWSWIFAGSSR